MLLLFDKVHVSAQGPKSTCSEIDLRNIPLRFLLDGLLCCRQVLGHTLLEDPKRILNWLH